MNGDEILAGVLFVVTTVFVSVLDAWTASELFEVVGVLFAFAVAYVLASKILDD